MSSRRARLAVLLVVLATALGGAGSVSGAITSTDDAGSRGLLGDVAVENSTESVSDTLVRTSEAVDASVAETTETVNDTVENTTDTVENTTDTVDDVETAENTTGIVNDTVTNTTGAVDDADDAEETIDSWFDGIVATTIDLVANGTLVEIDQAVGTGLDGHSSGGAGDRSAATEDSPDESNDPDESSSPGGPSDATSAALAGLMGLTAITSAGGGAAGAGASASAGQTPNVGSLRRVGRLLSSIPWELTPLSILRYSRYDDSDPLDHGGRRAIYEAIDAEPGLYLSAVSERTDVALSTVRHHVRVLEEEGLLSSAVVNGKRRYVPAADDDVALYAALDDPAKRRVLEVLAENGPTHNAGIADELDVDPSTVSHHLGGLEADELVERERDGRAIVTRLSPAVESALVAESRTDVEHSTPAPADD